MPVLVMNPEEVAARLGITPETVREYLREGKIRGFQVAGKWRISEPSFDAFVKQLEDSGIPSNNGPRTQKKAAALKRHTA
jgi:excisionase family DNA binding protein